jgi:hypothetical protein
MVVMTKEKNGAFNFYYETGATKTMAFSRKTNLTVHGDGSSNGQMHFE